MDLICGDHDYHSIYFAISKLRMCMSMRGIINIPEIGVVVRPKLTGVFKGRAEDCEAFIPHELVEERGNPGEAVAGNPVRGAGGLELLVGGQGEKAPPSRLNVVQQAVRDTMVGDLEHPPALACMTHLF